MPTDPAPPERMIDVADLTNLADKLAADAVDLSAVYRDAAGFHDALLKHFSRAIANDAVHLVFDQFPCPQGARFIEAEDSKGRSINAGEWRKREDGYVELVLSTSPAPSLPTREEIARAVYEAACESYSAKPYWPDEPSEIKALHRRQADRILALFAQPQEKKL